MSQAAQPLQRSIVITRTFGAPRELVFKAWTDPKLMAQWWGPDCFTNPVCELDPRPGGAWRIVMRAPDGVDYLCSGIYREVVPPERLGFTNNAADQDGKPLLEGFTTVTFVEESGKTKLTLETRAAGLVPYAAQMLAGMDVGWNQSLDRLLRLVAKA